MKDIIKEKYGEKIPLKLCLDRGFVQLMDCMPRVIEEAEESADYSIAEAARGSYQRGTKTISDDKTLIRYLMRNTHTSPFEMIVFKFKMKLPIYVARQIVRHRMVSINELSGRYSEMPEEYHIPGDLRVQSLTNIQGSEGTLSEAQTQMTKGLMRLQSQDAFKFYNRLLEDGIAREQARIVLPLSTYTEWYWKIDLKNLLHFLALRCDHHAQKEIQVYGNAILDLIRPIVPWTIEAWEDYSPYRGGMVLTRYEVEKIQNMLLYMSVDMTNGETNCPPRTIEGIGKLENKEWADKADMLGFEWDGYDFDEDEE